MQNENKIRTLYLWTEKGALLHAKSLNTDKAWEVYDYLVDFYFRVKEQDALPEEKKEVVPVQQTIEPVKTKKVAIPYMEEPIFIFKNLLMLLEEQNVSLKIKDMKGYISRLNGKRMAIRRGMDFERVVYEVAYETAHYFIHYDLDTINTEKMEEYNRQAEFAAFMIIRLLDIKAKMR